MVNMSKGRYFFRAADIEVIRQWLLKRAIFPPDPGAGVEKLQTWCDSNLTATQWRQIKAILPQSRPDDSLYCDVRITISACYILKDISKSEGLSMSEVIERYLGDKVK